MYIEKLCKSQLKSQTIFRSWLNWVKVYEVINGRDMYHVRKDEFRHCFTQNSRSDLLRNVQPDRSGHEYRCRLRQVVWRGQYLLILFLVSSIDETGSSVSTIAPSWTHPRERVGTRRSCPRGIRCTGELVRRIMYPLLLGWEGVD